MAHTETSRSHAAEEQAKMSAVAHACPSCTAETSVFIVKHTRERLHSEVKCAVAHPVQLEEPLDLLALSSSAAHQQVAQLIHRPQLVEDVTPLKTGNNRERGTT